MQNWKKLLRGFVASAIVAGTMLTLAACSTVNSSRVNLFEASDYLMTKPGQVITAPKQGIWLSRDAVDRLQKEGCLP